LPPAVGAFASRPVHSGVARARNNLAVPVNKNYRVEVKNRFQSAEEAKAEHLL